MSTETETLVVKRLSSGTSADVKCVISSSDEYKDIFTVSSPYSRQSKVDHLKPGDSIVYEGIEGFVYKATLTEKEEALSYSRKEDKFTFLVTKDELEQAPLLTPSKAMVVVQESKVSCIRILKTNLEQACRGSVARLYVDKGRYEKTVGDRIVLFKGWFVFEEKIAEITSSSGGFLFEDGIWHPIKIQVFKATEQAAIETAFAAFSEISRQQTVLVRIYSAQSVDWKSHSIPLSRQQVQSCAVRPGLFPGGRGGACRYTC